LLLGILHLDGELGLFKVQQSGISQIAKIMNHKKMNVIKGKEPVSDFILTQPNQNSVAFYVYEAFGAITIYQVFVS
jgi:hypothetical protein